MFRKPAITSLLNGQAAKVRFGSISVTSSFGSIRFNARAQLAPPKPPPITTMRAVDCANEGQAKAHEVADAAMPRTTFLRVIWRSASMSTFPKIRRRPCGSPPAASGERDVLVPQRHRADPFSCRCEVGVEHGGRRHADRGFTDAAPE